MTILDYFKQFDKEDNIIHSGETTSNDGVFIDINALCSVSYINFELKPLEDLLEEFKEDELYADSKGANNILYLYDELFNFMNTTELIIDESISDYSSVARRPYFRMRGKKLTEDQSYEIIRRTDRFIQNNIESPEVIHLLHFPNWWFNRNHIPTHYGWCHPSGIVGLNGITDKYPTIHELISDILKIKLAFPFLDLIIAITNYDEICESDTHWMNKISLGIWIHDNKIEFMSGYRTKQVYKDYTQYEENAEVYNPTYYESSKLFTADKVYLDRCIQSYGLNPTELLSKIKPYIWKG